VLVEAAEAGLLQDVLASWAPGEDWTERLVDVPRLAQAIVELADSGMIEVYQSPSIGFEGALVFPEDLFSVVSDPSNWMTDDGPSTLVELVSTTAADEVFKSRGDEDLYGFRNHG
jgi:hypothetical protein